MTAEIGHLPGHSKRERTRQHILDAAVRCFASRGVRASNMVDIASEAGVGRSTLYRHFPQMEDVLIAVILRDLHEVIERTVSVTSRLSDIEEVILEGFITVLQELPQRTVLSMLLRQEADLVNRLSLGAREFNQLGAEFCADAYRQASTGGRLRPGVSLEEFVEWSTRMLISLASMPYAHQQDKRRLRRYLKRFLLPSLLTDC